MPPTDAVKALHIVREAGIVRILASPSEQQVYRRARRDTVHAAARVVAAAGQEELRVHAGFRPRNGLERSGILRIWRELELAYCALERADGTRDRAKRVQLEESGGAPLTICIGRLRFPDQLQGDGCGRIFPDVGHARGAIFARYCAECAQGRNPRRERARAEGVRGRPGTSIAHWYDGRVVMHVNCASASCERVFFTVDPRRRRCYTCRPAWVEAPRRRARRANAHSS